MSTIPASPSAAIALTVAEAESRWRPSGCRVHSRTARIPVGCWIVLVLTASNHRQAALEATSFLIDCSKSARLSGRRSIPQAGEGAGSKPRPPHAAAGRWH